MHITSPHFLVVMLFWAALFAWLSGISPDIIVPILVLGVILGFARTIAVSRRAVGSRKAETPVFRGPRVRRRVSAPLPPTRFAMADLERRIGIGEADLRALEPAYHDARIPKRGGSPQRWRELKVPDAATKRVQRRILHRLLDRIPIHATAHGFERHRSIVTNATPHVGMAVVLTLDLQDFFGSTSDRRVRRLFRVLGWDAETAALLTRLVTHEGALPQGAPTSPRLANLVNVRLDARLAALAAKIGAAYTRYADDLTLSWADDEPTTVRYAMRGVRRISRQEGYDLHLERKVRIRRRHQRQRVTGLVINTHVNLPRERRRWLRAVEHRVRTGREATITEAQLRGWHAYELMLATTTPAAPLAPGASPSSP